MRLEEIWIRGKFLRALVQPEVKTIHVTSRILRSSTWLVTVALDRLRVTPDIASLFSIIAGISATYSAYRGNTAGFITLYFVWAILDCCDGELARLQAAKSANPIPAGAWLEKINSDLQYVGWIPALTYHVTSINLDNQINWFFFSLVACAGYSASRQVFNKLDVPDVSQLSWRKILYYSQCKGGKKLRDNNRSLLFFYVFWRNLLTQFGVFPLIFLLLLIGNGHEAIMVLVLLMSVLYATFSAIVILGILFYRSYFVD